MQGGNNTLEMKNHNHIFGLEKNHQEWYLTTKLLNQSQHITTLQCYKLRTLQNVCLQTLSAPVFVTFSLINETKYKLYTIFRTNHWAIQAIIVLD